MSAPAQLTPRSSGAASSPCPAQRRGGAGTDRHLSPTHPQERRSALGARRPAGEDGVRTWFILVPFRERIGTEQLRGAFALDASLSSHLTIVQIPSGNEALSPEQTPYRAARDGEQFYWRDSRGQEFISSWHPPGSPVPDGTPHGSGGVCFTPEQTVVLVTRPGVLWEFPQGRPEGDEEWRATLDREVHEEACASVEEATLLGYARGICISGPHAGLALVRSLWHARVSLNAWEPCHETTDRMAVAPDEAMESLEVVRELLPIYRRWLCEALAAEGLVWP